MKLADIKTPYYFGTLVETEQLNEWILPAIARVGPLLAKAWNASAPAGKAVGKAVGQAAGKAATAAGPAVRAGTEIAAKNAIPIAVGYEIYDYLDSFKNKLGKAADAVFDDPNSLINELGKYAHGITSGLAQGSLMSLAGAAVKLALPLGVVLAILYGGKKLIDKVVG
jgi:hypothetical protein